MSQEVALVGTVPTVSKTTAKQRLNFSKLLAILTFLSTIPEDKIESDDIAALKKEANSSLKGFLENPAIVAVYKRAEQMGIFSPDQEFTGQGAHVAQTCLNADSRKQNRFNYEETLASQKVSGKIAFLAAWLKTFKEFVENSEHGFKAEGKTADLFEETSDFLASMAGIEIIDDGPDSAYSAEEEE